MRQGAVTCGVLFLFGMLVLDANSRERVKAFGRIDELVEAGRARSPTFRRLVDEIEQGDWLVFVQSGTCPDKVMIACLPHIVGTYDGRRYLRVIVDARDRHADQVIGMIAHELQHALEIVASGSVSDGRSLLALTRTISTSRIRTAGATVYETKSAQHVGWTVLRELQRR